MADGATYLLNQSYSAATGLLETLTYPASTSGVRFKLRYGYQHGLLQTVSEFTGDIPGTTYWQAIATNARGQLLDEQLGNGLRTISGYDRITGELTDRTTTAGSGAVRQNLEYAWNKAGSLTQRRALDLNLLETFHYDSLGRLDYSQLNGITNLDMGYDVIGNVTAKSDMSAPRDATMSWSSYNLPTAIEQADGSYSRFQYAADRSRYKHTTYSAATGLETTLSIKGLYERVTRSAATEYKHSIFVPGGPAALHQRSSSGTNQTFYLLKDHLGSLDAITSSTGDMLARLSYSAFGERRNGATWSGAPSAAAWTVIGNTTHQGFTGHEHLDNVGLIHMNGRVFDPMLGQFTSADPFVQAPFEPQSLNRYSYVFNDPLSLVDPSGFCGATAVNLFDNTPGILDPRGNDPSDPNPHASANGNTDYGSNQPSFNTPCPQSELELYNSIGALLRAQEQEGTPIQVYSIRESGQNGTLGLVSTAHGIAATAQAGRGIGTAAGLGQGFLNAVPGAYYAGQSHIAFGEGRHIYGVALYGAALADAFVGVATLGQGSLVSSSVRAATQGTATIFRHGSRHVSILVRSGEEAVHTHQVVASGRFTTIANAEASQATGALTISLPNGRAALAYQRSVIGTPTGLYNDVTNSCVTHCADVLRAGGIEGVPETTRGIVRWLQGLIRR